MKPEFNLSETDGTDGNAFSILGRARKILRANGSDQDDIEKFIKQATSGDYDNLIQTVFEWFEVY
jgi:hypothetical protein